MISNIAAWCEIVFGNSSANPLYYAGNLYVNGSKVTDLIIPNSVTSIGNSIFGGCTNFASITIPSSVTYIGEEAFAGCTNLKTVYNGSSLNITKGSTDNGYVAYYADKVYQGIPIGDFIIKNDTLLTAYIGQWGDVVIPQNVTCIADSAFFDCNSITSVAIPSGVTAIGNAVFYGCQRLNKITCYANFPPSAKATSFQYYDCDLYVPCDELRTYKRDVVFGRFENIQCIEAEEAVVTTTTVIPAETEVTVMWPTNATANSYTLTINKDGVVFCTLTFNANGQLLNIAFAPGRDGAAHAPEAELTATGYQFTVTGLESGSTYAYSIVAKDTSNNIVAQYTGVFTTNRPTGIESIPSDNIVEKTFRNGHLVVIRDGKEYNLQGAQIK